MINIERVALAKEPIQFLYGDRELLVDIGDLIGIEADVIVNPSNNSLSHDGGLAQKILQAAGEKLDQQCNQLIKEYGKIDSGMAVFTSAGNLDYKSIIHAVGPCMGEGNEQRKLEQVISRSLQLCEMNQWRSIAFPAISTGHFNVPVDVCAQAFFRAITHFWDARHESEVERIILCLSVNKFDKFVAAFHDDVLMPDEVAGDKQMEHEKPVGEVDLSDQDMQDAGDSEVDDWFK